MKNEKLLKFIPLLLGILIIFGGAFLRVNEALRNDAWYDEAFTGVTIRQSWAYVLDILSQDRNHPPMFYAMVKFVTGITGSTDPFHLRLVSLFFGIATIPLSYLLIQQLSLAKEDKKWLGIATMTVLSFSHFLLPIQPKPGHMLFSYSWYSLRSFVLSKRQRIRSRFRKRW